MAYFVIPIQFSFLFLKYLQGCNVAVYFGPKEKL